MGAPGAGFVGTIKKDCPASWNLLLGQARRKRRKVTATPKIRVLAVDDHPLLLSGIAPVLEGEASWWWARPPTVRKRFDE